MNELIREAIIPFFDKLNKKIDTLENHLETLNKKLNKIEAKIEQYNTYNCRCANQCANQCTNNINQNNKTAL